MRVAVKVFNAKHTNLREICEQVSMLAFFALFCVFRVERRKPHFDLIDYEQNKLSSRLSRAFQYYQPHLPRRYSGHTIFDSW